MISRSGRLGAVAVVCLMLIAGCSTTKGPVTLPAATSSASRSVTSTTASPSPTPTVTPTPPVLPVAATKRTDAGAEAFVRYFWQTTDYGDQANDPGPMRSVSNAQCRACAVLMKNMSANALADKVYNGGETTVRHTIVQPGAPTANKFVLVVTDEAPSTVTGPDRAPAASYTGETGTVWQMNVQWTSTGWRVSELLLQRKGTS